MRVEPRAILLAVIWGGSYVVVVALLAVYFPESFLLPLFPAALLWLFLPLFARFVWLRFRTRDRD